MCAALLLSSFGCASKDGGASSEAGGSAAALAQLTRGSDLPITRAPFQEVHANWKQRLDQPYVFVEMTGSYTAIGDSLARADAAMRDQGLEPSGPPFALYYDDPGQVSIDQLRARACFPVAGPVAPRPPLAYDVLESTTVVYAYVAGPYPEVPRAYPGMFEYLKSLSWTDAGPIRESYLVDPGTVTDFGELLTEVQIPAAMR